MSPSDAEMPAHIFETERLIVRQFRADDLAELYALCSDAEIMRHVGDGKPLTKEQVESWIEKSIDNYGRRGFGASAVIDKSSGSFIGYCGLVYAPASADAEIIYALKKDCWGRGLASEVAVAMIDYGFKQHKLPRIIATIDPDNSSSIRIVEKIGMRYQQKRFDEHNLPELVYVIENEV